MDGYCAIFPGQGSQKVGMGRGFYDSKLGKSLFDRADDVLGFKISELCFNGPIEELTVTSNSQPAIFLVSHIAYKQYLEEGGEEPAFTAGHSLGEYSALVASKVISFEEALLATRNRGLFMLDSYPIGKGAMAAIMGATIDDLVKTCAEITESVGSVQIANYNTPQQTVISGERSAVDKVLESYKGILLQVTSPFHSRLMVEAASKMEGYLKNVKFQDTDIPVVSNVDNVFRTKAEDFPMSLISQITGAVRWDSGIRSIIGRGIDKFIEFGEGRVLSGMMKRIDKQVAIENR